MRILMSLTYYRPNVSGLTIYVERLATTLVERGHSVTVLAAQHDQVLPVEEYIEGIEVVRVPAPLTIGKAPLMPRYADTAYRLAKAHDVVHLHLPQLEASLAAAAGRKAGKPVLLTYHCDLQLPAGTINRAFDAGVYAANYTTGTLADRIVAYTQDYADHSPLLQRFQNKITVIEPPVIQNPPTEGEMAAFRAKHGLGNGPILGFASRLATEKGIEYGIQALPVLLERFPDLQVVFAGPYQNVVGEAGYRERIERMLDPYRDRWMFAGTLKDRELAAFYGAIDLLLMTSINSTESFGLVQVEAMLCGTPVVSTDLPGVRQPVTMTGMGEIVAIADSTALAQGIEKVLSDPGAYIRPREEIAAIFSLDQTIGEYESLYRDLIAEKTPGQR
ncbi:MAG TPA: glycosyltransferase family 4 protein [Thermomicrobiales bacterium]|nr:glycosyltransferase family 4 protein [Thermomicrobiales bacterium]